MFNKIKALLPDTPNSPSQPASNQSGFKRFGKKPYAAVIAIVAIAIIAVAFFIPQGQATIPLNVDYVVGEKMVYDTTVTLGLDLGTPLNTQLNTSNSTNINAQQTIEVMSFDGENYLLNHTMTMTVLNKPVSFSMTEKMNKTGYSTYFLDLGSIQQQEIPSNGVGVTYLAQLLNTPEVKVGDAVTIPFPSSSSQSVQTTGDLTMTFGGIQDLTVPAGTYRVFRIDIASNNLQMTLNAPSGTSNTLLQGSLSMDLGINSQMYIEYGTMRQIKSTMQETASYQSTLFNMTVQMGMDTTLSQHIKP